MNNNLEKKYKIWITILSIIIPLAVALLFKIKLNDFGFHVAPLYFLPPIYATINALTAILLVSAILAIKKGNRKTHEQLIKIAMACSVTFLGMYVAYHMTAEATPYGGEGISKIIYLFILISHIILSITVIPLVLVTYLRALLGNFSSHKKIAKWAFPLWLYVAVTGVIVYLMIAPYYAN